MNINTRLKLALAAGLMLGAAPAAFAAGTTAGTTVANTASVDFTVGGVNQPDVNSNTLNFIVDRKINLTVAEVGGAGTSVVPGATAQVTTFTVTNNSNATIDVRLAATQDASAATTAFGDTDNFNVTAPSVFVESGVTAGYQVLEDTATFIDELTPDTPVKTVYIVAAIPSGRVNGDFAGVTLTGVAAQSTVALTGAYTATVGTLASDAAETNTGVVDDATFIDTVFGDVAGDTDAAQDGAHSDDDQYNVVTASIVVTKSSSVVSDPFNGGTNPKAIPGAVIEYCLDVNNTGAVAAASIVLTDVVPTNTTFVSGSIKTAATGAGAACTVGSGTAEDDTATGADETDPDGGSFAAGSVSITSPSIAASSRWKATFRVTVN